MKLDDAGSWPYVAHALGEWFDELSAGGIFITDADLRVRAWNRWLEKQARIPASALIGVPLFEAFPELVARGLDQYYRDALNGEARVVAQRFHGYLLPVSCRSEHGEKIADGLMPQSARIAPLRLGADIIGTITVIDDVTDRVVSERELRNQIAALERARATAEAAVRTKDEFLATLSHELRTPLNAVLGWTRLLRAGQMDATASRRALEVIDRNATAQAQLIDDMLDLARMMQGKLRLDMQTTDVVPVVLAAIDVIRPASDAKRLMLTTGIEVESASVVGDANRLQQVVWNLLSNAVKFTNPGGRVSVHVERRDDIVNVIVADTGKGIAADFLPYVFDRFRQEDATTTRRYGGLGLGLSLARQLVELHGGSVKAESAGEGHGATFTVALPLRHQPPAVAVHESSAAAPAELDLAGRVVLLVDDDADSRDLLSAALERHGARVMTARCAADAFASLTSTHMDKRPEVLVADIGMPNEDGYVLMKRVRSLASERSARIPAIAVTGYAGPEDRRRALDAGFHRHFAKPVDPVELARSIAELLEELPRS